MATKASPKCKTHKPKIDIDTICGVYYTRCYYHVELFLFNRQQNFNGFAAIFFERKRTLDYVIEKCSSCKRGYIVASTVVDTTGKEIIDFASCNCCLNTVIMQPEPIECFGFVKTPTHSGAAMLAIQEKLAAKYHYQQLKPDLSSRYRNLYYVELPDVVKQHIRHCNLPVKTKSGTKFANGWSRVVIGDYGAFIEISPDQVLKETLIVTPGQEYRINDPNYSEHCKYHWLTVSDSSQIKVYFQQKTVTYADYLPNMYYVSPYEVYV